MEKKLFFDTEFTGLQKDTSLISIGIIDINNEEYPRTFYAEFTDYDKSKITTWIEKNVINNLILDKLNIKPGESSSDEEVTVARGNKEFIKEKLIEWLEEYKEYDITMISDVCHYDFTLFIDIFGNAFDLPDNITPYCIDLMDSLMSKLHLSAKDAFDMSRDDYVNEINYKHTESSTDNFSQHNSLFDAVQIAIIYNHLNKKH